MRTGAMAAVLAMLVQPAMAQPAIPAPAPDTPVTASPTAASPATPNPAAASPAAQELIYSGEASSILGRQVTGPDDKDVGRIVDVLVDYSGQPRAAVVDVGGFMGIGNRHIAVAWRALHFEPHAGGGRITLVMTADQIKETPEYQPSGRPVVVAAPPRTGTAATAP